jgi:hypothetical protein
LFDAGEQGEGGGGTAIHTSHGSWTQAVCISVNTTNCGWLGGREGGRGGADI